MPYKIGVALPDQIQKVLYKMEKAALAVFSFMPRGEIFTNV
ncbi:hypothetical protein J2S74_001296 [Evansella vedderi]|uniref:Uncharacterized protein n=1 Tax=Evansella vedderi TaxID=38282 RepID=A0ABT9ZRR8_9BACI|nr:hypothetical protein [Evansella vedderi]MDQ0253923.1 hypothetical protein [Evansella vedderi]